VASTPSLRWWITSSDAVWKNPIVRQRSKNPQLREWHTKNAAHKDEVTAGYFEAKKRD